MTQYGVVIDQSMIRNTVETTVLEATPLLSGAYFWHVALYGVLPAILVFVAPLARLRWPTELFVRLGTAAVGIALLATTLYVNYAACRVLRPRERRPALADQSGLSLVGRRDLRHELRRRRATGTAPSRRATGSRGRRPAKTSARRARHGRNGARGPLLVQRLRTRHESLHARAGRRELSPRGFLRHLDRRVRTVHLLGTRPRQFLACRGHGSARASSARCSASASARFGETTAPAARTFATNSTSSNAPNWTHPDLCDATGCFDELLLEDFDALLADRTRDHLIILAPAWQSRPRLSHGRAAVGQRVPSRVRSAEPT